MKDIQRNVLNLLEKNGHHEVANDLRCWLLEIQSNDPSARAKAAEEVRKRCHVKWIGDLAIDELSYEEWLKSLAKLRSSV